MADSDDLIRQLGQANKDRAARQEIIQRAHILQHQIERNTAEIEELQSRIAALTSSTEEARKGLLDMPEPPAELDTTGLERQIAEANEANRQYARWQAGRAEYDRLAADVATAQGEMNAAEEEVARARQAKMDLFASAEMPDPDISISDIDGELLYRGDTWEQLADSDALILCCKIVSRLNPECRFVLVDGLEKLDRETLAAFDEWAQGQGLQVIGTRVTDDPTEATILIEDGEVAPAT